MKKKSIVRQAKERLWSMAAWGQSKHSDKLQNGGKPAMDKIYSHSTMDNYVDVAVLFVKWARAEHGCKTLEDARQFTGEYLNQRVRDGKSTYPVRRDVAALESCIRPQRRSWVPICPHARERTSPSTGRTKAAGISARRKTLTWLRSARLRGFGGMRLQLSSLGM